MAEKGDRIKATNFASKPIIISTVEVYEYDKKKDGEPTGEKGRIFTVNFVGGAKVKTFSTTAQKAFESHVGETLSELEIECTGQFKDADEYKPIRAKIGDEVIYDAENDAEAKPRGRGGGGGRGGGFSRPEWSYEKPEERLDVRLSIEHQVAFKGAVELVHALAQYDDTVGNAAGAAKFVIDWTPKFASVIRPPEKGAGSGGARKSTRSSAETSKAPSSQEDAGGGSRQAETPDSLPPENSVPTPEPAPSSGEWE